MKINYGYSDGGGDYFIAIDVDRCDGCGECLPACPSAIFEIIEDDDGQPKASVMGAARNRLDILCPGFDACQRDQKVNCHSVCQVEAITHAW